MDIFHLVLSGYAKLSHNFTTFNVCDVTLVFAVERTTDSSVWQNNSIFFEVFFEDIVQHLQSKRQSQFCQAKGQPLGCASIQCRLATILDKTVEKIVYLDSIFLNIVAVPVLPSPLTLKAMLLCIQKKA